MKHKATIRSEEMRRHIEACRSGSQTVSQYCKAHELLPSSYYYWQKRLKQVPETPSFTQLIPAAVDSGTVSIYFPNGIRMVFSGSVSCSSLKELACCI